MTSTDTKTGHPRILPGLESLAVELDRLEPLPGNPRRGDVAAVARSLARFGQHRPLVARPTGTAEGGGLTGVVLVGNHALAAARSLGWDRLAVVWADEDEATAKARAVADNRTGELGSNDSAELLAMLEEIRSADGGALLAAASYSEADLAEMDALLAGRPLARTDPDAAPPVPETPASRLGDVWVMGPHRLMCGDCTDPASTSGLFGHAAPKLLLTDPPYCSGGFQESGRAVGSVGTSAPHKQVANDTLSTRGYMALIKATMAAAPSVRWIYVFTDWRMWVNLFDAAESSGFGVRSMVVWDKGTPGMGRGWRTQHELIMWAAKETAPFRSGMSAIGNVVQAARTGNKLHTTQKPVDLLVKLLEVADFADKVYDPFAGSGSTLIACHALGRIAYLMEMDPAYCDVICRRYAEHTGIIPILESTGAPFPIELPVCA